MSFTEPRTGPVTASRAALEDPFGPYSREIPVRTQPWEGGAFQDLSESVSPLATAERPVLRPKHLKFKQEFVDGHQPCSWKKEWGPEGRVGTRPRGRATQSHAGLHQSPGFSPRPHDFGSPFCPLGQLCRTSWVVS